MHSSLCRICPSQPLLFVGGSVQFSSRKPLRIRKHVRACSTQPASTNVSEGAGRSEVAVTQRKLRVLSGVQPTGVLHLGNYLGAVRQWVENQDKYDGFFTVVDLHAITMPHNPKELMQSTLATTALYIACGLDPAKNKIFIQSHVTAHSELAWLLNCATPLGWMERMVQYKEKAKKAGGENVSSGLFNYPILMAADVLLYQADLVPVGEDQTQHLELARNIVGRFNNLYDPKGKKRVFKEPKTLLQKSVARVMSLDDGTSKMSKSDANDGSRINLLDPPDVIKRKIKKYGGKDATEKRDEIEKCKTDSVIGLEFGNPERPECNNLLNIYEALSGLPHDEIAEKAASSNFGTFKKLITDVLVETLEPIQKRHKELMSDRAYLNEVLLDGADSADAIANETLNRAQEAMGFVTRRQLQR